MTCLLQKQKAPETGATVIIGSEEATVIAGT